MAVTASLAGPSVKIGAGTGSAMWLQYAGRDDRGGAGVEHEVFGRLRRSRDGVFRRGGERRVRLCLHAASGVLRPVVYSYVGRLQVRGVRLRFRGGPRRPARYTSRVARAFVVTVHVL